MNQWANDWVQVYSNTDMNFMTTNMEDSGTLTALHRLDRLGLVDAERVLVLRTVSNYTVPPPGESAAWSATAEYPDQGLPALEAAYQVGRYVVDVLVDGWSRYASRLPAVQD
jgi:purine nucleoside permease